MRSRYAEQPEVYERFPAIMKDLNLGAVESTDAVDEVGRLLEGDGQ